MIDLHCHSLYSDGTDTPEDLARLGHALGLSALALTDHDTVDGLPRFLAMQDQVSPKLLPGTELSCTFLGKSLHVLGLLVDPADARFQARLEELRNRRGDRNHRMIARLQELGIAITLETVQAQADSPLLSRVHIAMALRALGVVQTTDEAFRRLIGEDCPGYVSRQELTPREAARWIREAGGVPLIAHPGRFAGRAFRWDEAMVELRGLGMAGFESIYGEYGPEEQAYFRSLAARLGMTESGGSDYHGANKPGVPLGRGRRNIEVPDAFLAELELAQARGDWN
jgi:hypothetical protein